MKTNLGNPLTRNEMKELRGGKAVWYDCTCNSSGDVYSCTQYQDDSHYKCFNYFYSVCGSGGATCTTQGA